MKKTGKFVLVTLLVLILLSLTSIFASFASAGELQVTEEHPFLVNDSWIPAKNLSVGDELLTIDGKKVRITEIEEVVSDETFSVYNLEAGFYHNFIVNGGDGLGVVVHNSLKFPLSEVSTKLDTSSTPAELINSELEKAYHHGRIIEILRSNGKRAPLIRLTIEELNNIKVFLEREVAAGLIELRSGGAYKDRVYYWDASSGVNLPKNLEFLRNKPGYVVVKFLRGAEVVVSELPHNDLHLEEAIGKLLNKKSMSLIGENFVPETYEVYQPAILLKSGGKYVAEGMIIQEGIESPSILVEGLSPTDPVVAARALNLQNNLRAQFPKVRADLERIIKEAGVVINDMTGGNLVVQLKDSGGEIVSLSDVLASDTLPGQVKLGLRTFEVGGSEVTAMGRGKLLDTRGIDYLNNLLNYHHP